MALNTVLGQKAVYSARFNFVKRFPLNGYSANKRPYLLAFFNTGEDCRTCINLLKYPLRVEAPDELELQLQCWETDIHQMRKFLTALDLGVTQWFNVLGVPVAEKCSVTTHKLEYLVDYRDIKPISFEESATWGVHPTLLVFDIETYSPNHYKMPVKTRAEH